MSFPHPQGNESLSYWIDTTPATSFGPVAQDERADVVVVGAGIAGLTSAYLLARAGKSVVVVDRERIAMAETGHTTAHLQSAPDTRLSTLIERFGPESAKLVWDSQLEAVRTIEAIAQQERIACELRRLDAFLYTPKEEDVPMLREEIRLIRDIGYEAREANVADVPFKGMAHAIRIADQGKFHPRKYLLGVVEACVRMGVRFFEGTEVVEIEDGEPMVATTREGHKLRGDWLLETTNIPFSGPETMSTKVMPYRTYVIGAKVPKGVFGDALYWDTLSPYHYTRVEHKADHDLVILGGGDHKVGTRTDTNRVFDELEEYLRKATDRYEIAYRWSGEIMETEDDLPYIGRMLGTDHNHLVATGFSGTGMTNGTLSAVMLSERVLGRGTPWDDLYDAKRLEADAKPLKEFGKHNLHAAKHLVKGLLRESDIERLDQLAPGEGAIVRDGLKRVAIARRRDGRVAACDATCTHMGCVVSWNKHEESWDCPCHGSRFAPNGDVLHGPAVQPLARAEVPERLLARERDREG